MKDCSRAVKNAVAVRLLVFAASIAVLAAGPARAEFSTAPDVVVYCEPALRHAIEHAGALFRAQTHVPVRVFAAPGPLNLAQLARGVRDDVLIARAAEMDEAARQDLIDPASRIDGWHNRLVLAVRGGPVHAATVDELLNGGTVAVTDPTVVSGLDGFAVIAKLGKADSVTGAGDTIDVAFLIGSGSARLGLVYLTEVRTDPALSVGWQIPPEIAPPVAFAAALNRHALSQNSRMFLDFLHHADAMAQLHADGLEPTP